MITTKLVMRTLYKARTSEVDEFAEALFEAAAEDEELLDGSVLDKKFNFGLAKMKCDSCLDTHWFVVFASKGHSLEGAVIGDDVLELNPVPSFEQAVAQYQILENDEVRH